ncbi:MAG: hypothetical protein IH849_13860 [Acidobacteria bacterium]|nr:hypothetical protein [Acidobacteriota bacterium]
MARYRDGLPQLGGGLFLTDSGQETALIFHDGFDLPLFAAFDLLKDETGTKVLRQYYRRHASIALQHSTAYAQLYSNGSAPSTRTS